jgi:cytochrome c
LTCVKDYSIASDDIPTVNHAKEIEATMIKPSDISKIAAAFAVAVVVTVSVTAITGVIYQPKRELATRGYQIAVETATAASSAVVADAQAAAPAAPATVPAAAPAAATPVDIAPLLAKADLKAGEIFAKKCAICHDFTKGGKNKIGPALWEIVGKDRGAAAGFAYSAGFKTLGGKWDYQNLSEYLTAPQKYVKGTKMVFAGIPKPEERANVILYLRSLSDTPAALPAK